jgi:hypothetical protein
MSKSLLSPLALAAVLVLATPSAPSFAADAPAAPAAAAATVPDLAGMDAAASLGEWLKLTDDQKAKLKPVMETRFTKVDAALAKVEAAEEPDVMGFISEYGAIRKEFDAGVTNILTPDQAKQWDSFKVQLEKELSEAGAHKQLAALQPQLKLTDEQVTKLTPAMATANQKKIDVLQKLADGGRIGLRDKLKAKNGMGDANGELEKTMATIVSPDQLAQYKAIQEKKKADRKAKK